MSRLNSMSARAHSVFAEPWWLDAVAPGRWDAASVDIDGETVAYWPYTIDRMVGGLVRVGAAPLTPYLGPHVCVAEGAKRPKQISISYGLVEQLLAQLPDYDVCKLILRPDEGPWYPLHAAGFSVKARQTYVIDDPSDMTAVWDNASGRIRRAVRKAEKRLAVTTELDSEALWQMVRGTFGRQDRSVPYDEGFLARCVDAATTRDRGRVLVARDEAGRPHAAVFVVWDQDRTYYLVGGADPSLRESNGPSLLLCEAIKHSGSTSRAFDFEGSMLPNVEHFFSTFGGRPETVLEVLDFSARGQLAWNAHAAGTSIVGGLRDAWDRRRT